MNFLGNPPSSGVTPEQEEKLDAIAVEPSGELKIDSGLIVNGGTTELKTTITEVDDPILQINRPGTGVTSGITIKNTDDGKFNSILRSGTSYFFTKDTTTDSSLGVNALERANIVCGNVNSVNVGQLNGDYNLHVADTSIHTPLNDGLQTNTNIWSASKIASEITANSGAIIDDVTPALDKVYSSSKTQNIVNTVQNNLTTHTSNADIHRQMADGLTSTTTLWSSQKTANEIGTVNTALGLHTSNNLIHAELNDTIQTNTNLWSADKTQAEIGFRIQDGVTSNTLTWSSQKTANEFNGVQTDLNNLETSATRALIQDSTGESKIELSSTKITNTADEHSFVYKEPSAAGPTYLFQYTSGNGVISNGGLTGSLPNTTGNRTVVTENASWFSFGDVRKWKVQINSYSDPGMVLGITKWNIPGQLPAIGDIPNQNFIKTSANMFIFTNGGGFLLWDPVLGDLPFPNANGNSVANGHSVEFKVEADGKVFVNTETNNNVDTLLYTIPNDGAVWKFWLGDNTDLVSNATVTSVHVSGSGGFTPVQKLNIGDEVLITSNLNITGDLNVTGTTTSVNTDNITIEDTLIKLANNNTTNVTNIGFIGQYNDGNQKFCGLMQTYNNNHWVLLGGTTQVPSESVLTNYNLAELGTLDLNQAVLSQVLPYFPASGIRLINGTEEIKVGNSSIDFTNTALNINSVQQDTKVSAFGQYYVNYSPTSPLALNLNSGYDSAFAIPAPNTSGQNVGYASPTNTFTILHAGWYRISYILSLKNLDNDSTFIRVTLRKNGAVDDSFEKQSVSRHLRMKNRANTFTSTFIHSMALNDTIRLHIEATEDNGNPGNESIHVYDANVNIERMRNNF